MPILFKLKKILIFVLVFAFALPFPTLNPIYEIPEAEAAFRKVVFLTTSNTSWTVPADWNNRSNIIEVIGGGGGAGDGFNSGNGGAGGGGYAKSTNLSLPKGNILQSGTDFSVGAAGVGTTSSKGAGTKGGNTWFMIGGSFSGCTNNTLCVKAEGGEGSLGDDAIAGGVGGNTASATGLTAFLFNGGDGGAGHGTGDSGGGGGGAGGPCGAGKNGGVGDDDAAPGVGGGGGGNGGGTAGGSGITSDTVGGNGGDNCFQVSGGQGGQTNPSGGSNGTNGGGGGGSVESGTAGNGGNGVEWDSTHGSGGGGGGGGDGGVGGAGGSYGGGAGGGEGNSGTGVNGGAGLIVITYVPAGHVIRGNVKIRGVVKFR